MKTSTLDYHPLFKAIKRFFKDEELGKILEMELCFCRPSREELSLYTDFLLTLDPELKEMKAPRPVSGSICFESAAGGLKVFLRTERPDTEKPEENQNYLEGRFFTREGFLAEFFLTEPDADCPGLDLRSPWGEAGFFPLPQGGRHYYFDCFTEKEK